MNGWDGNYRVFLQKIPSHQSENHAGNGWLGVAGMIFLMVQVQLIDVESDENQWKSHGIPCETLKIPVMCHGQNVVYGSVWFTLVYGNIHPIRNPKEIRRS